MPRTLLGPPAVQRAVGADPAPPHDLGLVVHGVGDGAAEDEDHGHHDVQEESRVSHGILHTLDEAALVDHPAIRGLHEIFVDVEPHGVAKAPPLGVAVHREERIGRG